MEKLLLIFLILSWNICMTMCDQNCECYEMSLLKEMLFKEIFERKLESSRFQARIRRLELTKRPSPLPSEAGSADSVGTDRHEQMEAKIANMDIKLNDCLAEKSKNERDFINSMKKGLKSEKNERTLFVSEVKRKLNNMNESFENFKTNTITLIQESSENLNESIDNLRQNMNVKFNEIGTELIEVTGDVEEVRAETMISLEEQNANTTASQIVLRRDFGKKVHDLQVRTEANIKVISSNIDSIVEEIAETVSTLNQKIIQINITIINECDSNPCRNGGACTDGYNQYTCTCTDGWTGTDCDQDINECDPNPCQNGASCVNGQNQYTCSCTGGWTGTDCDQDINECDPNPCQNRGRCKNGRNQYTCTCTGWWTGTNCDQDEKPTVGARVHDNWPVYTWSETWRGTVTAVLPDGKVKIEWDLGGTDIRRVGTGELDVTLI